MQLIFGKGDAVLIACLVAIATDPMPYTLLDDGDRIIIYIPDEVGLVRVYKLGGDSEVFFKVINGLIRDYKSCGRHSRWVSASRQ